MNLNVSNILDNIGEKESRKPRVVRSSEAQGGLTDEQLLERLLSGQTRGYSQDAVRPISTETQETAEVESRNVEIDLISIVESPFPEIDSADVEEQEDAAKKYYPSILSLLKYEAGFWVCTDGRRFIEQYPAYLWQLKIGYKGKTDKKPEKPASGGTGGTMDHAQLQHLDYASSGHTGFQEALVAGEGITIEGNVISSTGGGGGNAIWGQITGTLSDQTDLEERFEAIEELIPDQASDENQLADKAFVNSSISTNTANFCGTYNVVTDLGLTTSATEQQIAAAIVTVLAAHQPPIVPTNNDYAFVAFPNATVSGQFDKYDRYKYNGSAWGYEYTLNNSSFTAEQWAAVNSGITAGKVTEFEGKQDALTAGSGISLSGASINTQNIIWRVW